MPKLSVQRALVLAGGLLIVAAATWQWRVSALHAMSRNAETPPVESWDRVKTEYPVPPELQESAEVSVELAERVIRANPFSQQRRTAPPPSPPSGHETAGQPAPTAPPQFHYKGRVQLGQRQRAIVEETVGHKTYFLEVGQAVAGFKVLDMTETQVVLSAPLTNEAVVVSLESPRQSPPETPTAKEHVGSRRE